MLINSNFDRNDCGKEKANLPGFPSVSKLIRDWLKIKSNLFKTSDKFQ